MKVSNSIVNLTRLKSVKTFADFQVWIKGVKNNSGEFDYVQLRQFDQINHSILETAVRLKSKEYNLEIMPVFPDTMMDLIVDTIADPNARFFIPVIGIRMICRNRISKHDIVNIELIKRDPNSSELDLMRSELKTVSEDFKSNIKRQLR